MKLESIQLTTQPVTQKAPVRGLDVAFGRYDMAPMGRVSSLPSDSFVRQASTAPAIQKLQHSGVRFGGCVCPICASIGLIDAAYSKVQAIESGQTVQIGSALSSIADQTGFDYITHEDGTRLLPPANDDLERLKRVFAKRLVDDRIHPPGIQLDLSKMTQLSKWAYAGFARREQELDALPVYSQHNPILPLKSEVMPGTPEHGERYLLSIVHQMFPEKQRDTQPVSMGALMAQRVLTKRKTVNEITIIGAREYPTMENMNIAPAGISNMLALQALQQWGDFDTVGVLTSPDQHDIHEYMKHLKAIGVPIKTYEPESKVAFKPNERIAIPIEYDELDQNAYGMEAIIYQVDVRPLREWAKTGLPEPVRAALLERDPAIADKLNLTVQQPLNEQQLLTVLRVPPAAGARVFRSGLEEHGGDGHDHDHHDHDHVHGPNCGCGHSHGPLINLGPGKVTPPVMTARRVTPTGPKLNVTLSLGTPPAPTATPPAGKLKLNVTLTGLVPPKQEDPPKE